MVAAIASDYSILIYWYGRKYSISHYRMSQLSLTYLKHAHNA